MMLLELMTLGLALIGFSMIVWLGFLLYSIRTADQWLDLELWEDME